jgi:hypothetical protein
MWPTEEIRFQNDHLEIERSRPEIVCDCRRSNGLDKLIHRRVVRVDPIEEVFSLARHVE